MKAIVFLLALLLGACAAPPQPTPEVRVVTVTAPPVVQPTPQVVTIEKTPVACLHALDAADAMHMDFSDFLDWLGDAKGTKAQGDQIIDQTQKDMTAYAGYEQECKAS